MSIPNPIDNAGGWNSVRDTPVPVPPSSIGDSPTVSLCINRDWVIPVFTALKAMTRPEFWSGESVEEIRDACIDAFSFVETDACLSDIQFRSPTACTLEVSLDGGESWTQILDVNACIQQDLADGVIQPGSAQPTSTGEHGECQDFIMVVPATGAVAVPILVSSGDTVQLSDIDTGPWLDSFITAAAYCSDGHSWTFPAGCGSTELAHENDPLQTANHMALIAKIGDDYYDVSGGDLITVPSGVTDATVFLQPNDDILYDNLFSIQCTVEVCKTGWTHVFDLVADDGNFEVTPGFQGTYVPGVGWSTDYLSSGGGQEQFVIRVAVSGTPSVVNFELEVEVSSSPDVTAGMSYWTGSGFGTNLANVTTTTVGDHTYNTDLTGTLSTYLTLVLNGSHYASHSPLIMKRLTVQGLGSDPFP